MEDYNITTWQACRELGVTYGTVIKAVLDGSMEAKKVHGKWLISQSSLNKKLEKRKYRLESRLNKC